MRLAHAAIPRLAMQRAKDRPAGRERREVIFGRSIVLDEDNLPAAAPYPGSQTIDALYHRGKVMLLAAERKALLHIDDQKSIHAQNRLVRSAPMSSSGKYAANRQRFESTRIGPNPAVNADSACRSSSSVVR